MNPEAWRDEVFGTESYFYEKIVLTRYVFMDSKTFFLNF